MKQQHDTTHACEALLEEWRTERKTKREYLVMTLERRDGETFTDLSAQLSHLGTAALVLELLRQNEETHGAVLAALEVYHEEQEEKRKERQRKLN